MTGRLALNTALLSNYFTADRSAIFGTECFAGRLVYNSQYYIDDQHRMRLLMPLPGGMSMTTAYFGKQGESGHASALFFFSF